jgi:hypothetical protein
MVAQRAFSLAHTYDFVSQATFMFSEWVAVIFVEENL